MHSVESQGPATERVATTPPQQRARSIPIVFWSAFGLICLAFQTWVFARWIGHGDWHAVRAADDISFARKAITWQIQITVVVTVVLAAWWVGRQRDKEGRATIWAVLFVGYLAAFWTDPIFNYARLGVAFNNYSWNVASWGPYIPGWHGVSSPQAESVAIGCLGYVTTVAVVGLIITVVRRISARRPHWGMARLGLATFLVCVVVDVSAEVPLVLSGAISYPGAIRGFSLFAGHWYQFPMTEAVLASAFVLTPAALLILQAGRSNSAAWILRGLDRLPSWTRSWAPFAAGIGFTNLCFLLLNSSMAICAVLGGPAPLDMPGFLRLLG